MKKIIISMFVIVMIAGISNKLVAQTNSDNATSSAFATIVAPIGISHSGSDLQFGTIIKGIGTVTLATTDVRTFSNAALNPGDQGVSPAAAVFTISGEGSYTYSITFTNATEILTNGTNDMEASSFVALSSDGEGLTGTLSAGTDTVKVGATLTLDNDETAGEYVGSFEVTVAYN
jgi:hypothetical protein